MKEIILSKTSHRQNTGISGLHQVAIISCQVFIYAKVDWQTSPAYVGLHLAE
jgi:hypothetical protein